jgi:multicomponent Na+:H+ antiporter subunit D
VALLTPFGMQGASCTLPAHATLKITLFFCAGAIYVNLKRKNISNLNGIAKVMPWTMGAFTIGSMGLAGIPPINGFFSKWTLALGSLEGDMVDSRYYTGGERIAECGILLPNPLPCLL